MQLSMGTDKMAAFLAGALALAGAYQTSPSPAQDDAVQQCRASITEKVNGAVIAISVQHSSRTGTSRLLKGKVTVQRRPLSRPGELSAAHIVNMTYSYECTVTKHRKAKVVLSGHGN